jgi:exopolyphosphatase/guanosine-5'-triphosphate,3'-diphosphate pyrophosphatase
MPGAPSKRIADLPFAALVLRRLLRATNARRVIFSANGLREGWYARLLDTAERKRDPLLSAAREMSLRFGRDHTMPPALFAWTAPLFEDETPLATALREAACWVSDIGSHDHPDYRAEHAFYRVLRQPGVGFDHHGRAFLALAAALRYEAEAEAPFLPSARLLLDVGALRRAEILGAAFRLAYTLSGGTPVLLAGTAFERRGGRLVLRLLEGSGVFAGESVLRRLETLAAALGVESSVQLMKQP